MNAIINKAVPLGSDIQEAKAPSTPQWSSTGAKRLVAKLSFPIIYALNRPLLQRFAEAVYDFALRLNGHAINFPGRHGVGYAEERFLARLLPDIGGGVLVDVGANAGSYLLEMRRLAPNARIHAFEPHPKTFAALSDRVHAADATLVNAALSDRTGTMQLHDFANKDGSTQASLAQAAVGLYDSDTIAHDVEVMTLDDYMDRAGLQGIDFLKIDTEGFDLHVLRGARRALARKAIRVVQFEIIPADIATRVTVRDFFEVLQGYDIFRLCLNGELMPIRRYDVKRCEVYVTSNMVAIAGARPH